MTRYRMTVSTNPLTAPDGSVMIRVSCSSCVSDAQGHCPWHGRCVYDIDARQAVLRATPWDSHEKNERHLYNTFTSSQRATLQSVAKGPSTLGATRVDLLSPSCTPHAKGGTKASSPTFQNKHIRGFLKRQKEAAHCKKQQKQPHSKQWEDADFQFLVASSSPCDAADIRTADETLHAVSPTIGKKNTCIVFLCGTQMAETLGKLTHKDYVILSLDGKFRMVSHGFVLLAVGVVAKHWGQSKNIYKYRSQFIELGFCLAHSENELAYTNLMQAIFTASAAMGLCLTPETVKQWHADMHSGLANARAKVAATAAPISDWVHVTGATTEGKSGILSVLSRHLHPHLMDSSLKEYQFVCKWIFKTYVFPNVFLFDVVWRSLFQILEAAGDKGVNAVKSLKRYHFQEVKVGGSMLWDAAWRVGFDRVLPGTGFGTAAQESWHKNVLMNTIPATYQMPHSFFTCLQGFVKSRLVWLRNDIDELPLWPSVSTVPTARGQTKHDIFAMKGNLRSEGRSSAKELVASCLCAKHTDVAGNVWYAVPATLWKPAAKPKAQPLQKSKWQSKGKPAQQKWFPFKPECLPRHVLPLVPGLLSNSSSLVNQCLVEMGVGSATSSGTHVANWALAESIFMPWAFVCVGPKVAEFWKLTKAGSAANTHSRALCLFCKEQCVCGPCEHVCAALVLEGRLPSFHDEPDMVDVVEEVQGEGRQDYSSVVAGPATSAVQQASAAASASATLRGTGLPPKPVLDPDVAHALKTLSIQSNRMAQQMAQEEVTFETLRLLQVTEIMQLFGLTLGKAAALKKLAQVTEAAPSSPHPATTTEQNAIPCAGPQANPSTQNPSNPRMRTEEAQSSQAPTASVQPTTVQAAQSPGLRREMQRSDQQSLFFHAKASGTYKPKGSK